jgi:hypothetical protein
MLNIALFQSEVYSDEFMLFTTHCFAVDHLGDYPIIGEKVIAGPVTEYPRLVLRGDVRIEKFRMRRRVNSSGGVHEAMVLNAAPGAKGFEHWEGCLK